MPDPSPDEIRTAVTRVLADPAYAWWHAPEERGRLVDAVLRLLAEVSARLASLRSEQPAAYWALMASLVAVAVALLAHAAWTVRAATRASVSPAGRPGDAAQPDYRALAADFATRGDYLEAARHVQLAVLDLLVARRVITLARSEPNAILCDRLRQTTLPAAARGDCVALLRSLERACFRDHAGSAGLYQAWCVLHERLARETA